MGRKLVNFDDLLNKVKQYIDDENDLLEIKEAFEYALEKHKGQYRKTKDPYITHPLQVAMILTDIEADKQSIMAALLHDVVTHTDTTINDIEKQFGQEVSQLVDGVTQLGRINFSTENEYLIEYYKKIVVGMSKDVRVIIIKLADRLHNMRTLFCLPVHKQKEKAKETLEILAPIAHHLGIHKLKSELEDLSLRYLKPEVFYDIAEKLNTTRVAREHTVEKMQEEVTKLISDHNISHKIKGRAKSIYSIYHKLENGRKFSDIYDLLALRILVGSEQECYLVLGLIHSKFKPVPKRFKDYIAMPKPNGYRSLHTTVFGLDDELFEIQIRTYEMDEMAENGVASHWAYKEKKNMTNSSQNATDKKLQIFKTIMELSEDKMSNEDFVSSVQDEILNNNIYVFTPKGDIIELPNGSTPIDFAYRVHTKVGEKMVGAIVNNSIVPLSYKLKNNDIVKININNNSKGPSKEWLNIAGCTQTKNKIKSFFAKSEKERYIEEGKNNLEKQLRKQKLSITNFYAENNLEKIYRELKIKQLDDLYFLLGNGKINVNSVIQIIYPKDETKTKKITVNYAMDADVIVDGIDKVKVNLASCCNPLPQDEIVGYITKNNGISVHRSICHNVAMMDNRYVSVHWNENTNKKYFTSIIIYTDTLENHLADIVQKLSAFNVGIDNVKTLNKDTALVYEVSLYVLNSQKVNQIISELSKISYIIKVERVIQ